jgi:hypothetical protein
VTVVRSLFYLPTCLPSQSPQMVLNIAITCSLPFEKDSHDRTLKQNETVTSPSLIRSSRVRAFLPLVNFHALRRTLSQSVVAEEDKSRLRGDASS